MLSERARAQIAMVWPHLSGLWERMVPGAMTPCQALHEALWTCGLSPQEDPTARRLLSHTDEAMEGKWIAQGHSSVKWRLNPSQRPLAVCLPLGIGGL